jgi:hypothetical protein
MHVCTTSHPTRITNPLPVSPTSTHKRELGPDWPAKTAYIAHIFPWIDTHGGAQSVLISDISCGMTRTCTHLSVHVTQEFDELFNATDSDYFILQFHAEKSVLLTPSRFFVPFGRRANCATSYGQVRTLRNRDLMWAHGGLVAMNEATLLGHLSLLQSRCCGGASGRP